jgi:hypothetical protein
MPEITKNTEIGKIKMGDTMAGYTVTNIGEEQQTAYDRPSPVIILTKNVPEKKK